MRKAASILVLLILHPCLPVAAAGADVPEFTGEGFRVPQPGQALTFPRDHGNHPDYKIEWWYLTGHLKSSGGKAFGYQATFFRFATDPGHAPSPSEAFGNSQLFSSQAAITDVSGNQFLFDERFDRAGWDARSDATRLDHIHGPWRLKMTDPATEEMRLQFSIKDRAELDLTLLPEKPKVIFGEDGTSRKGADATARSYYITFSRLAANGALTLDGETFQVTGDSWMDHEIASQQLGDDLEGWDWTAIQLEDGREIKAYLLRQKDGRPSPFSRFIWIGTDGRTTYLTPDAFSWTKEGFWQSPQTHTRYPVRILLRATDPDTGRHIALRLTPKLEQQEILGDLNETYYWEGACTVTGPSGENLGNAYLELVGYHDSLEGRLR